jgi:hypothetical protein
MYPCALAIKAGSLLTHETTVVPIARRRQNRPLHSARLSILLALATILLVACGDPPWNNPHPPAADDLLTYQSVMTPAPPKHLDPAISYASDEALFIMQIAPTSCCPDHWRRSPR